MKKLHYFLTKFSLDSQVVSETNKELLHRISRVLKIKKNEHVKLINGEGYEVLAQIKKCDKDKIVFSFDEKPKFSPAELTQKIYLFCALAKRNVFETIVQKATELGVREIIPIVTERTVKEAFNYRRLEKIIQEAVEQSERAFMPVLHNSLSLYESVNLFPKARKIIGDRNGIEPCTFIKNSFVVSEYALFIGPEGGFSEKEINFLKEQKVFLLKLTPSILKMDTAVVCSLMALQLLFSK